VAVRALRSVQAFVSKGPSLEIASTMPTTMRMDSSTATIRVARVPQPVQAEAPAVLAAWAEELVAWVVPVAPRALVAWLARVAWVVTRELEV
jgi:hypothetical protein